MCRMGENHVKLEALQPAELQPTEHIYFMFIENFQLYHVKNLYN